MDKTQLYEAMDLMSLYLDTEELLTALALALDVDTLEDMLAFISRAHGLLDDEPKLRELKERE